jgi:phytoene/squalene synthetase
VGEDAVKRGRVYLPLEDIAKFGVTEEQIFDRRIDDNYRKLMKYQIERAITRAKFVGCLWQNSGQNRNERI